MTRPNIDVHLVNDRDDIAEAYRIRTTVFVDEQGVPPELELDERDASADHFLAFVDGKPVGAGRLVVEPAGFEGVDTELGGVAHLGRLAVLADVRGLGLGVGLVQAIEARVAQRGLRLVYLGAQTQAVPFYERLGYSAFGEVFDDAGLPHAHMMRAL